MSAEACLAKIIPRGTQIRYLEVGVLRATNLVALAEVFPLMHLTGVDSYKAYSDPAHGYTMSQTMSELNKSIALSKIAASPHSDRIDLVVGDSSAYANSIPDHAFDIVFLDKGFEATGQRKDITDFYHKVKPGGIFCGHDAWTPEIWDGVVQGFADLGLPNPEIIDSEVWFFVKHSSDNTRSGAPD